MKQFGRKTICEGNRAVCVFDTTAMTKRGREYRQHFAIEFEVNDEGKLSFIRENFDTLLFHNIVYGD
jgi:ketosteroid isomerase-like protein